MKERTINDYCERLNRVLVFIGENLDQPLSLTRLAEVACFSPFHFHRLFAAHLGETLHDHVRRLRLERAALRLAHTGDSVTDIALTAGFETPANFTRAFREHFGLNPTTFRESGWKRQALTTSLDSSLNREEKTFMLLPEMKKIEEIKVLFIRRTGPYGEAAAAAWGALMGFAYSRRLMTGETLLVGISHDNPHITPENHIRYDACITFPGEIKPEGEVGIENIAGGRYAVFLHRGPHEGLGATYDAIFTGWLPAGGARLREAPCFEVYLNRDPRRTKPENLRTQVWVPVE